MWLKWFKKNRSSAADNPVDEFKELLAYEKKLADHKLGYPVSLLTYLGLVDNSILGIKKNSLSNILMNNVGDPFKDSETSLMEVKKYERKIISILENFYLLKKGEARGYVTTGGTEGNFAALWWTKRYMINTAMEFIIKTDDEIRIHTKNERDLAATLAKTPLNDYQTRALILQSIIDEKNGIGDKKNIVQQLLTPTVFYTKEHTHYSISKIADVLRLNIRSIAPNSDGSMNLANLKKELILHVNAHPFSSIVIITNIGTTITGAIDNVPEIKKILEEIKPTAKYSIHMDGALTGFVLPVIKPFGEVENYFTALGVNTLAVSAHKYPGMSQPCGIMLSTKEFFDKAFEKTQRNIDYVGNISDVTITGSRSGLNVLMFYNALCTLGIDKNNDILKRMVDANFSMAKYLYDQLIQVFGKDRVYYLYYFNVSFPRPSLKLAKKYQLMLSNDRATICVLSSVTKRLIDEFIIDLKMDKEEVMNKIKTDFKIETLKDEHVKPAADLFTRTFCKNEPITKHLDIEYDDYVQFAQEVIQNAVKNGMSKVLLDAQGQLIGVVIAEDIADRFQPNLAEYPKLKPVFALLDEATEPFITAKKFKSGTIAHFWIAAVETQYMGQGIFTVLNEETINMVAKMGYKFAYAEFTNEVSEKITHQFKIVELVNRVQYEDFEFEGQFPFKGVKGAVSSYVAAIGPGITLDNLPDCYTISTRTIGSL